MTTTNLTCKQPRSKLYLVIHFSLHGLSLISQSIVIFHFRPPLLDGITRPRTMRLLLLLLQRSCQGYPRTSNEFRCIGFNGWGWIRTTSVSLSRFYGPLPSPLGYPPLYSDFIEALLSELYLWANAHQKRIFPFLRDHREQDSNLQPRP